MANENAKTEGLVYRGHPLRRIDNLIYYGTMAEKYIVMMQIQDTKKVQDLNVASKVSVQLQHAGPEGNPELTGHPLKAASAVVYSRGKAVPQAITKEELLP